MSPLYLKDLLRNLQLILPQLSRLDLMIHQSSRRFLQLRLPQMSRRLVFTRPYRLSHRKLHLLRRLRRLRQLHRMRQPNGRRLDR